MAQRSSPSAARSPAAAARPSTWAYVPVLGAFVVSIASMALNDVLVTEHVDLRGPTLALRLAVAIAAAPVFALPWLLVVGWILRRQPHSQLAGGLAFVWMVSVPGAYFGFDAANVELDRSTPRTHAVRFVEDVQPRKGSAYSVVSSWRDADDTVALSSVLPGRLKPGEPVWLTVKDGALGWEYVMSARRAAH